MAPLRKLPNDLFDWLRPGDALLYRHGGFVPWLIRTKTWSPVSHIEVYAGDKESYAARNDGVKRYPFDTCGCYMIRRPKWDYDQAKADAFFEAVLNGQRYDTFGLLRFFRLKKESTNKQQCGEMSVRLYRASNGMPFDPVYPADLVSPGMFLSSPLFEDLWSAT